MVVRDVIFLILWCVSVQNVIGDTVDFSKMGITRLRRPFLNSSSITHLDLSDNHIWNIENRIFDDVPNLVHLNLTNNIFPFSDLSFDNNSALEILVLDKAIVFHSDYFDPNDYIGNFESLEDECNRLIAYENIDNDSPSQLIFTKSLSLPKLKHLYLRKNGISSVVINRTDSLDRLMPEITHIYLTNNKIESIDFIKDIPMTLTHLYLDYNDLKEFDIDNLNILEVLALDGNPIDEFCGIENSCVGLYIKYSFSLKILTLSHMNLKKIAADAFRFLGYLVELDMSHNKIRYFPAHAFETLFELKTFRLDNNELSELPDICSLQNLENLSISNNYISSVSSSNFCNLSKLKRLNLSGNSLDEIPAGVFDNLTSLEELDLSKNLIVTLPDNWISSKINLQYLYLNNNLFPNSSSLSLTSAKNLKFVAIGGNYFNSINRESLIDLPKNATISFENNKINVESNDEFYTLIVHFSMRDKLDRALIDHAADYRYEKFDLIFLTGILKMLRNILMLNIIWCVSVHCVIERLCNENHLFGGNILDLSKMGIMLLKNNFVNSSTITHIDLSDNIWKIEDGAFDSLPNLKYLNLSQNLFEFLNIKSVNLSAVETLVLDDTINENKCDDLHDRYGNLKIPLCRFRYVRWYVISFVSIKLPKLKKLYLRQNEIRAIYTHNNRYTHNITSLSHFMPRLTHLYVGQNYLTHVNFLQNFPPTLTHLYLENNHISEFKIDSFPNSLKVLSLDGNEIRRLCSSLQHCTGVSLQSFGQLQNLSISNGTLEIIESNSLKYSSTLISLDLSNNRIREIANITFRNLMNLKTLKLDNNQLKTIPNICDLVSLEYFSITNNSLKSVDLSNLCSLSKLKKLNLSNNALEEIIPGAFDKLDSLEELDLSNNKLVNLATNWISSKVNLQYSNLHNNLSVEFSSSSLTGIQSLPYVNISGNPLQVINIKTLKVLTENTTVEFGTVRPLKIN
ncbi:protein artichoke-like [Microplitis mediator]|uniref:protein artichoke-like n=1 Tax=Microplitis mediator TaxID=375433 RepID=UPI002556798C|nr:protein artichoke-like [Microplitis mediator]